MIRTGRAANPKPHHNTPRMNVFMGSLLSQLRSVKMNMESVERGTCDIHPCMEDAVVSVKGWNLCEEHKRELVERKK